MKKAKRYILPCLAFILMLSLIVLAFAVPDAAGFSDVDENAWYAGAVVHVREQGLMSGTSGTTFSPDQEMTRAMLATVLYRAAGSPEVSGSSPFSDVAAGAWYHDAILWASQNGLVGGYGNGLFGVNDPVTREQMITILWRYAGCPAPESGAAFADGQQISSYARDAVSWCSANGVISGVGGNRFDPNGIVTRAQAAMVLMNYYKNTSQEEREMEIEITAGGKTFAATLYDNDAARALADMLPMTLNMEELNGNEKYYYLDSNLPANSSRPAGINTGDLMLYGSNCLVLFYKSFSTSYSYTPLGHLDDPDGLAAALGGGSVQVTFQKG